MFASPMDVTTEMWRRCGVYTRDMRVNGYPSMFACVPRSTMMGANKSGETTLCRLTLQPLWNARNNLLSNNNNNIPYILMNGLLFLPLGW